MFNILKKIMVGFILAIFFINQCNQVFAVQNTSTLTTNGSKTIEIGKWDLLWPLNDYRIQFYSTLSFQGSSIISWSTTKDLISTGDSVSLNVIVDKTKYNFRADIRTVISRKSNGAIIIDRTDGTNLPYIDVPGTWASTSIPIPVIPFEIIGIPVELSVAIGFSITSQYILSIDTVGLQSSSITFEYNLGGPKNAVFTKSSGVGAEFTIKKSTVKSQGNIKLSAILSVAGVPTPFKIDFPTISLGNWETGSNQNLSLAILKTPVSIDQNPSSTLINFGDLLQVRGKITPEAGGISIQLITQNTIIGTSLTSTDGSYSFSWRPSNAGSYSIYVKALESKYTTEASSQIRQIVVNKLPECYFTFSPFDPKVGSDVLFTDSSTDMDGQIVSWSWNFGDGITSHEKNPTHKFATDSSFTVSLTVTDNNGGKVTETKVIKVSPAPTTDIFGSGTEGEHFISIEGIIIGGFGIVIIILIAKLLKKRKLIDEKNV